MQDPALRAVIIGVSIFISIVTITALMLYYNTAKELSDTFMQRTDISSNFKPQDIFNMEEGTEYVLSAIGARNLVRKLLGEDKITVLYDNSGTIIDITHDKIDSIGNISEAFLEEFFSEGREFKYVVEINNDTATVTISN